jgi:signal peptidase I
VRRATVGAALLVALGALLVGAVAALGGHRVAGRSMEPALADGALVVALPWERTPNRFDVVVYLPEIGGAAVKRVIALPGDGVRIAGAAGGPRVQVRPGDSGAWQAVDGPAGPATQTCCAPDGRAAVAGDAVVPEGAYFLLGDNPAVSIDSRQQGFVPADRLRGRVVVGVGGTGWSLAP